MPGQDSLEFSRLARAVFVDRETGGFAVGDAVEVIFCDASGHLFPLSVSEMKRRGERERERLTKKFSG